MIGDGALEQTELWQYLGQIATKNWEQYNVDISWIAGQLWVAINKEYLQTPKNLPHDWSKGPEDSSVTILEFSDFECPYCQQFYKTTYAQIVAAYWDKVNIRFKNLPLSFHEKAQKAAEAAQCANRQWKFWEMHDALFENQKTLSDENYKVWAKEIWLDADKFNTCLDNWETAAEVDSHAKQAQAFWVQWTPWFFVNNKFLNWAVPFEQFKAIIDAELK